MGTGCCDSLFSETDTAYNFERQVVDQGLGEAYCNLQVVSLAVNTGLILWAFAGAFTCKSINRPKRENGVCEGRGRVTNRSISDPLNERQTLQKPRKRDTMFGVLCLILCVLHCCLIGEAVLLVVWGQHSPFNVCFLVPISYLFSTLLAYFVLYPRFSTTTSNSSSLKSLPKLGFTLVYIVYWLFLTFLSFFTLAVVLSIGAQLSAHLQVLLLLINSFIYLLLSINCIWSLCQTSKRNSKDAKFKLNVEDVSGEFLGNNNMRYLHPYSSPLSRATFAWCFPLLKLGYRRPIELQDLGEMPEEQLAEHQYKRFLEAYEEEKAKSKSMARPLSLWSCYWKTFRASLAIGACIRVAADLFGLVGPLSIKIILDFVDQVQNSRKNSTNSTNGTNSTLDLKNSLDGHNIEFVTIGDFFSNGFVIAFIVLLATFLQSTFSNNFNHLAIAEGIHLRSALQCLVYKKALKMTVSLGVDAGGLVNHASVDAFNMMMLFSMGHYIWAVPLKVIILLYLLYSSLGYSALIGAATIYVLAPIQYYLSSRLSKLQEEALKVADERLRKTNELLMGIKLFKLMGWELMFCNKIKTIRDKELKILRKDAVCIAINTFITQATSILVTLVSFVIYPHLEGAPLTPSKVFTGLALFNQLTVPLYIVPFVIPIVINACVSSKRIASFLSSPEIDSSLPWRTQQLSSSFMELSLREESRSKAEQTKTMESHLNLHPNGNGLREEATIVRILSPESAEDSPNAVQITDGYFSWDIVAEEEMSLMGINVQIPSGKLTVITGSTGSGKSSLVAALLGEMVTFRGTVEWSQKDSLVAFVPQSPWLLNTSLKENILFGRSEEFKIYTDVIRACCLQPDIDILPGGDGTEIGERGINLSGGQRQRVALARAIYSQAATLILDDPLSALDAHVSVMVFENAIKELLVNKGRTVVLVTHKVEHMQEASKVIVMVQKDGRRSVKHEATFKEIEESDSELRDQWLQSRAFEQELRKSMRVEEAKTERERHKLVRMLSKQALFRTHSTRESMPRPRPMAFSRQISHDPSCPSCPLPIDDWGDYEDNLRSTSDSSDPSHEPVKRQPAYLRMRSIDSNKSNLSNRSNNSGHSGNERLRLRTFDPTSRKRYSTMRMSRKLSSQTEKSNTIKEETEDESEAKDDLESDVFYEDKVENGNEKQAKGRRLMSEEERQTGHISSQVYLEYMRACSPWCALAVLGLISVCQASKVSTDFWLAAWTNSASEAGAHNSTHQLSDETLDYYVKGYVILSGLTIAISLATNLASQLTSIRAVRLLHRKMILNVVKCPVKFFDVTPIGRIINRFGSDINTIDKKLPTSLPLLLRFLLVCLSAIVVDIIVTPYFAIVAVIILLVYYFLQDFFRSTSRELQRLDSITKSPIFSHFNQTISGLSTIRAFKQEGTFMALLYEYIDVNNLAFLMVNCSNCLLGVALDYLGGVILFSATIIGMIAAIYGDVNTSSLGLVITYTLLVPIYLNWVVRNLAFTEMYLNAVERIREYSHLEVEDQNVQLKEMPVKWPAKGLIELNNVSLKYDTSSSHVLKNVNLLIKPGEKIGVCGRTGSGKSSLVMALFKMITVVEGKILIDGVDIRSVPAHYLRSRLSLVAQDSLLFTGTIRENLDPGDEFEDNRIWEALDRTGLRENCFSSLSDLVTEDGSNLSIGQQQLVCLARALLRDSPILVLDEATSALDSGTEQLMQEIVAETQRTVISVAHRISSLLSFDRVVVLHLGQIVEMGTPKDLLSNKESVFNGLLQNQNQNLNN